MSRLDCSSAEVKAALEEVSNPSGSNEWAVFGYVPKSGNVIKVDSKGSGFDDMVEEFSEGKVQYAYYRVPLKGAAKFVYVAWCGEGVIGMAKGSFGNHSNDFGAHLKKGFAVHHQVNARSEADLDEKKIQAALVKAAGANYDAGAKKQGMDSTAKAMGELKTFHISEQARAVEVGTGRASGASGASIDKTASDQFWQANKTQPKAAAPPPSRPAVDEEARKQFWQQQQQEQAAAKAASAKAPVGRPAPGGAAGASALKNRFEAGSAAPPASGPPPGRPAPGKVNTGAFTAKPTAAPPSGPPKLPPSAPPSGPPSSLPPVGRPAPGGPPPVPAAAPPVSAPPPAMPPRMPEPEATQEDDGWGDDSAAAAPPAAPAQEEYAAPAQEEYAQEEYAQEEYAQEEYAQEEYAQEEYAAPAQEEYAQEEYAQEEYAQEEYAQEEYAQEEYAGQEEYAQEEYAGQEEYGYTQVQALHDYAGQHDEDLSFSAGDWITVHERDESGWWKGELNGRTGYFPSNFVQQ